ncbi:MAG: cupin domain-containing protein [Clostridiales bacterium]|nr:cupin domain-containing protein [Clostridiales bacterium]
MTHPYLIDLNDKDNWLFAQVLGNPAAPGEDQRTIQIGQGTHRLCTITDSIMYPRPQGAEGTMHFHEHQVGYEYFFLDSGGMDLYVDSKKTYVAPGSIVFFQPGQAHGMSFRAPSKYRGVMHDFKNSDTAHERWLLKQKRPDIAASPDYMQRFVSPKFDSASREAFPCVEVPVEQVSAVRHISRPLETFTFEGLTMKLITARWENGGVKEMWAAEMEPGFTAEWVEFPTENEMYYVTEGEIRFKVYDEEFTAYPECFVKIPLYAAHSIKALKKSVMYDIYGQPRWQAFLQDHAGIMRDPARANDKALIEKLKEKYGVQIKSIGMEK